MSGHCAVIDVGKTNIKVHVVDAALQSCLGRSCDNRVVHGGRYPHFDIGAIWLWICRSLHEIAEQHRVDSIVVTTHGATAAIVHPDAGESGLVLPVMDYEFDGVASESDYNALRPLFSETFSPSLPAGLNLGRQLFWQQRYCSHEFSGARYIFPYPQYWGWRLTGVAVSEVTSWGCHTDLWAPRLQDYSTLVDRLGVRAMLPPLVHADTVIGLVRKDLAEQIGLPPDCRVCAGVHDSNASYLRYLPLHAAAPFTVISTGTWVVSFSSGSDLDCLDERRDMLANVDINGNAVACARFMGGREYEAICLRTGARPGDPFDCGDLQQVVNGQALALPDFSGGCGPFGGRPPEIRGRATSGPALAALYGALMTDYELDLLGSEGDVIIEGAWLRNPLLCRVLAQLRPQQRIHLAADETGTVGGAAQLALGTSASELSLALAAPTTLRGLDTYRGVWREALSA